MKTASLIAFGLALVGTGAWAMSDTHAAARASDDTSVAATVPAPASAGIPPYGAMSHRADVAGSAILPYGAMSNPAEVTEAAILPYGVMHPAVASPDAILPYGAVGPHAAP